MAVSLAAQVWLSADMSQYHKSGRPLKIYMSEHLTM
jgi:hypothetical protein